MEFELPKPAIKSYTTNLDLSVVTLVNMNFDPANLLKVGSIDWGMELSDELPPEFWKNPDGSLNETGIHLAIDALVQGFVAVFGYAKNAGRAQSIESTERTFIALRRELERVFSEEFDTNLIPKNVDTQ